MKTYIAASFERRAEALDLHNANCVSTWYLEDTEYSPASAERAYRDALQIEKCDRLIFLMGDKGGCNRFWELGYAMGLGKKIILIGNYDNCIFERLSWLRRFDNVEAFRRAYSIVQKLFCIRGHKNVELIQKEGSIVCPMCNESYGFVKEFEDYCNEYPHVSRVKLFREFEDKSGDLRHSRISVETGNWP